MLINIDKLGASGLVFDYEPYDLPANVPHTGANVVMNEGRIEKSKGYQDLYTTPSFDYLVGWFNEGRKSHILATSTGIFKKDDLTSIDPVTPPSGFQSSVYWQHTYVGNVLLMNNDKSAPFVISPKVATFVELTNWTPVHADPGLDYTWTADEIVSFSGFLVATGINKNGGEDGELPLLIKWSDVVSNDITFEGPSWDESDPTTLAGENPISAKGEIVTAKELNGALMIYTQAGAHVMTYVGGQFVFNFRSAFDDDGLLNKNCVAEFFNKHLCVGFNSIYVTDGNTKQQIADGTVQDAFYNALGDRNSVFVINDILNRKILIHFKSKNRELIDPGEVNVLSKEGGGVFDSILVYSYKDNTWSFQIMEFEQDEELYPAPNNFLKPNQCALLPELPFLSGSWLDIQAPTWSTIGEDKWSDLFFLDGINRVAYSASPKVIEASEGYTYTRKDPNLGNVDINYASWFDNGKIDLSEYFETHVPILYLSRIFPQVRGSGILKFQVGVTKNPSDVVTWEQQDSIEFDLGGDGNDQGDYKIDLRRTGRYLAIRVLNDDEGWFKMSGFVLEVEPNGLR
jgi:hypothetical protein